jgi:periplasmic copper chaperone A
MLAIGWPLMLAGAADAHGEAPVSSFCPWMRPTFGDSRVTALYMTLTNAGAADDALVAVATPVAARAEIHVSQISNGIVSMRAAIQIELPGIKPSATAGLITKLEPGSAHVMLTGLTRRLTIGERIDVTLQYRLQPPETVQAVVAMEEPPECHADPYRF